MATHTSREEMLEDFGPYSVAFSNTGRNRNSYNALKGLATKRAIEAAIVVRDVALAGNTEQFVLRMLRDINWRPHMVAAVSTFYRPYASTIVQMWAALDAGSWVTPQLAAVLSIRDSEFTKHAIERLSQRCPLSGDPEYHVESAVARHSAQGPAGSEGRSAKSAASLYAIVQADSPDTPAAVRLASNLDLRKLVGSDADRGGLIATSWRDELLEMDAQP